jgi:CDP-diacylglycerol--serine O-phosphatidyltransferase
MADPGDDARPEVRGKHFAMLRSFALPDFITLGNAACGAVAMFSCVAYVEARSPTVMWTAFALFPLALLCDVLDGAVARRRGRSSNLGADLDSLADVISFGAAPAVLGYALGMRSVLDVAILVYFVLCGVSRLARYNVTAASLTTVTGKVSHYQGTPIPSSLVLVAVLAIAFGVDAVHEALWLGVVHLGPVSFHPLALMYVVSGSAMASGSLKIPKP